MTAIIRVLIICLFVIAIVGCGHATQGEKETFKVVGEIQSVEKTIGVVDGVKSGYAIKLINIEPGSNPDPKDVQEMTVAVTKDTSIQNDQKKELNVTTLKPGSHVKVTWRFANDHLTEAMEIIQSDNVSVKKAAWNYKEGYVVAKEDQGLLVVRETTVADIKNKNL
jgi:hypothetical protein